MDAGGRVLLYAHFDPLGESCNLLRIVDMLQQSKTSEGSGSRMRWTEVPGCKPQHPQSCVSAMQRRFHLFLLTGRSVQCWLHASTCSVEGELTNTRWEHKGGHHPAMWHGATPIHEIRSQLAALLEGRILVGHHLKKDLGALGLSHPESATRDTLQYRWGSTGSLQGVLGREQGSTARRKGRRSRKQGRQVQLHLRRSECVLPALPSRCPVWLTWHLLLQGDAGAAGCGPQAARPVC